MPNKPTARRPPSTDERRQRRAFRAWWLVAILGATVGGLLLLLASGGDDPEENPSRAADATTAAPAGGLAECALLPETWEFAVTGTEESSERGTRYLGTVEIRNVSPGPIRVWQRRSETSGAGDVSEKWSGGGAVPPGGSVTERLTYATLNDGPTSWLLTTAVVAAEADGACERLVPTEDELDETATELELPFDVAD